MFGLFEVNEDRSLQPLYLYNTATKQKELFKPLKKKMVTIYSCGPTVYDHIHIGNLLAYLLPDLLTRLFLVSGYQVKSTINFTDFGHLTDDGDHGEDKIMKGMRREGLSISLESMRTFAEPYIESFKMDNQKFGNRAPSNYTRASDYVRQQVKLIETLEQKGYAYETSDGVYFDVGKFPKYGQLGNLDLDKMKAGARVEVNKEKHHPADFALWKKGELGWDSRWGLGFPGWHIECTAMAFATLGKQIDIHTGGEDLMYTHHNGEIAQAECATGKKYVNYWLHNAHVKTNDEKFAKSAGNGLSLKDLEAKGYCPLSYRYWLLQSHYRTAANFSWQALDSAAEAHSRLKRLVYLDLAEVKPTAVSSEYEMKFTKAMHDDLNTPQALAILWELVKDEEVSLGSKLATIHLFDSYLGLGLSLPVAEGQAKLGFLPKSAWPTELATTIKEREAARDAKEWETADSLRQKIVAAGYQLEDTASGPQLFKNN